MTRFALALAALLTLTLNGSLAAASMPGCTAASVCTVSLRMMAPPPSRPTDLAQRLTQALIVPASGRR